MANEYRVENSNENRMKIGYARVSTEAQNLDMQIHALMEHGIPRERIHTDKMTGTSMKRPGMANVMKICQSGEYELVVWKIDRLGRSVLGVSQTIGKLRDRGVTIKSLTEPIDTTTPMGVFVLNLLVSLAQMERDLISERTKAGLERARARGAMRGRPIAMTPEREAVAIAMLSGDNPATNVAVLKKLQSMPGPSISRQSMYSWKKRRAEAEPDDPSDDT